MTELSISQKVSNLFNAQTEWGARSLNGLLQNIHTYLQCMCSNVCVHVIMQSHSELALAFVV